MTNRCPKRSVWTETQRKFVFWRLFSNNKTSCWFFSRLQDKCRFVIFLVLRSEILVHCSSQRVYFRQKLPIVKIRGYQTSPAVYSRNAHFAADTNHNTCAFLTEFSRRWMHPLLYRVSGNHRNHCKPLGTNLSTLVYLQMDHYNSWRLNSSLTPSIIIIIIKL